MLTGLSVFVYARGVPVATTGKIFCLVASTALLALLIRSSRAELGEPKVDVPKHTSLSPAPRGQGESHASGAENSAPVDQLFASQPCRENVPRKSLYQSVVCRGLSHGSKSSTAAERERVMQEE